MAKPQRKPKRKVIHLKHPEYQPSRVELEEEIKVDVPGDSIEEKMSNLAKVVTQDVEIRYRD